MKHVIVTYKVKPAKVAQNEQLVKAVYQALARVARPGLHYMTAKLEDGLTFQHTAIFESDDDQQTLSNLPEFKAFQEGIADRCDIPPQVQSATLIGECNFLSQPVSE